MSPVSAIDTHPSPMHSAWSGFGGVEVIYGEILIGIEHLRMLQDEDYD